MPGGAPPPTQEVGALEAVREPGKQVELEGEAHGRSVRLGTAAARDAVAMRER